MQLIGSIDEVIKLVEELCAGRISWDQARERLPLYAGEQDA